jgi:hypothetical protein
LHGIADKLNNARRSSPPYDKGVIRMARRNRLVVPGARESLEQMKNEIAQEFGVELGADTTARANGSVGGEMTKRLVALGSQVMEQQRKGKAGE